MKTLIKNFFLLLGIFLLITVVFSFFAEQAVKPSVVGIETLVNRINQEEVSELIVSGDKVMIILKDGSEEIARKEPSESLTL
jgi:hypothetical protein